MHLNFIQMLLCQLPAGRFDDVHVRILALLRMLTGSFPLPPYSPYPRSFPLRFFPFDTAPPGWLLIIFC